jgi:KaiC/GvpD/RAD55 family RecA-like ATPase
MNDTDKDILHRDRGELEAALKDAGATIKGKTVKCPFHDDAHASGNLYESENGVWRFKCHGCDFCGDLFDVKARATGRKVEDVLREMTPATNERARARPVSKPAKRIFPSLDAMRASIEGVEAVYSYTNPATGTVDLAVVRYRPAGSDRKQFIQARPVPGGFVMEAPAKPLPIYNRTRLASADSVVVVEGEKCVHLLASIGIVATTSPGGAGEGKAASADWSPLAGKTVYLWPDSDAPDPKTGKVTGIEHMNAVAKMLETLDPPARVSWIDPAAFDLPPKGDVEQYLELYGGETVEQKREAIHCAIETARPVGGAADLDQLIEQTISGNRRAIPWPWRSLGQLTKALMPGTVTCICGDPGSTKSFLMLEAGAYWHENGVKVAIYELEEDRAYHLNRVLAQRDHKAELTDPDWVEANPAEARDAFARHRTFLDSFAPCIHAAPDKQPTLVELAGWVEQRASAGCRIIVIDPVTAASTSDKPWLDDLRFLMTVKTIARQSGASIVLVTHPRKGRKTSNGLDDLAGGASYPRFSQTVVWITRHEQFKPVRVASPVGDFDTEINRSLRLGKTRNGRGAGLELGYVFEWKSLRFSEQGVVLKKAPLGLKGEIEQTMQA